MTIDHQSRSAEDIAQQIADTLIKTSLEAVMGGRRAKPALMAKQGTRTTYMLSLPIGELLELVVLRDTTNSEATANRPINDKWVRSIESGLRRKFIVGRDSAKYVLFPFTGNIDQGVATFRSLYEQSGLADMGILVLPQSAKVGIADGQHRIQALRTLVREISWLADEAVDLFIIEESDVLQQRTDFSDAAKVLPINVTLQAWFDNSIALNAATQKMVSHAKMFTDDDIEKFKTTVSGRRNPKLWTYNSLRGYVGAALAKGTPQKTEELADSFEKELSRLEWDIDSLQMDEYSSELASYLDLALEETAGGALRGARQHHPDAVDWEDVRTSSLLLKSAGLNVFALLIHDLREKAEHLAPGTEHAWVQEQIVKVAQLGWSQSSETFKGTLVRGGRIMSSTTAVSHAAYILELKLGLLDGAPRRTVDTLLHMLESGELTLTPEEKNTLRMAKRDEL